MPVNVLVVDDSDVIRSMIIKTLRLADVPVSAVYEAGNGREALAVLDDHWIDVVLADINMPVMDGVEMLRRIRASADNADLPVVVVSTEAAASRLEELAAAGVSACVYKPFTPERIRDVLYTVTKGLSSSPTEDITRLLRTTLVSVLEQFVLMPGESAPVAECAPGDPEDLLVEAQMSFHGRMSGSMTLLAPHDLCREMASNVLGVDEDDPRSVDGAGDTLGEVLNMTCGLLVNSGDSPNATDLTPPTIVAAAEGEWERIAACPNAVGFDVEGRPMLLQCSLRPAR
jgi:two-component system, chemotaxis family, chemotaxis protein CheY